jgi:hypothetical protein
MAATQHVTSRSTNHAFPNSVAIDRLAEQLTSTALGARKQTRAPKGPGEEQLRKDVARNRNRCFATILRIGFADLRDGESIEDVTAALREAIDMLESYSSDDAVKAFKALIEIETCIQCDEDRLTVAYLCGDESEPTITRLDRAFGEHIRALENARRALHQERYRSGRAA